jgi:hypothetical protein
MVTPGIAAVVVALVIARDPAAGPALAPELSDCRVLVDAGRLAEARSCYEQVATAEPPRAALARALAELVAPVSSVSSDPPQLPPASSSPSSSSSSSSSPASDPLSLDAVAWRGRGELIASAALTGGMASFVGVAALSVDGSALQTTLSLAAPVLGAGVAGGVAAAGVALLPGLNDGDVHLARAGLWAGAFDAACVGVALTANSALYIDRRTVAAAMLLTWGLVGGAGMVGAAAVDVADAAPSLGLSFLWIGALSTGLGLGMADLLQPDGSRDAMGLVAMTAGVIGTASGLGGVALGNALQLTRASVWLVDIGAAVGALSAYALASSLRAGTPALGWGTVLGGTLLGAAAGLVAARHVSTSADGPPSTTLSSTASPLPMSSLPSPSSSTSATLSLSLSLLPSLLPVVVAGGRVDVVPVALLTGSLR